MPLNLHQNAKTAASTALGMGLPHIQVTNGVILDSFTAFLATYQANEAWPQTGQLYERLVEYVDDLPLVQFVTEYLRRELSDDPNLSYSSEVPRQPLVEIPSYQDIHATAHRLIEAFDTLPWAFTFSLQLPKRLLPEAIFADGAIALGESARIVKPDLLFEQQFPLSHPNPRVNSRTRGGGALSLLLGDQGWKSEGASYQRDCSGFVGIYGGGNLVDGLERGLESFLGLGLATRLFTHNFRYQNEKVGADWIAHLGGAEPREFYARFSLDEEVGEVMRHMDTFRFENSYPEENRIPWLLSALARANGVFLSPHGKTLLLSAKWFFDSFKGRDETLRYIRLMTTLEILLGEHADTSKASLGEILGNRLAYLVGANHQDRASILSEFKKTYGVRSSILHHGKHRLRGDERGYISKLQKFCERAIEEETRLLLA